MGIFGVGREFRGGRGKGRGGLVLVLWLIVFGVIWSVV